LPLPGLRRQWQIELLLKQQLWQSHRLAAKCPGRARARLSYTSCS
jgi:hypothetical protein